VDKRNLSRIIPPTDHNYSWRNLQRARGKIMSPVNTPQKKKSKTKQKDDKDRETKIPPILLILLLAHLEASIAYL
jgi:hypothetical protein